MKKKLFKMLIILSGIGHLFMISSVIHSMFFSADGYLILIELMVFALPFIFSGIGLVYMFLKRKKGRKIYITSSLPQIILFLRFGISIYLSFPEKLKIIPVIALIIILKLIFIPIYRSQSKIFK